MQNLAKTHIYVPYTNGDLDSTHDAMNTEKPICIYSNMEMTPAFQQGQAQYSSYNFNLKLSLSFQTALDCDSPGTKVNTIDALPWCKLWFEECESSHYCCKPSMDRTIPMRLVYISQIWPRLHSRIKSTLGIKYATLSHSWGLKAIWTLTSTTSKAFDSVFQQKRFQRHSLTPFISAST